MSSNGTSPPSPTSRVQTLAPQWLGVEADNVTKVSVVFDVDFAIDDVTYIT